MIDGYLIFHQWYVNFNKGFDINQCKGWWQLTHFSQKNFVAVLHCFKTLLVCILVCVLPSGLKRSSKHVWSLLLVNLPFLQTLGIYLGHCYPSATSRECSWWQLSPATSRVARKNISKETLKTICTQRNPMSSRRRWGGTSLRSP